MQDAGLNVQLCLSIHDSLLLVADERLKDEVDALLMTAMVEHSGLKMRVPMMAETKWARSWGALT
jgi:DNA polymerase I-like protein with 3'-5' exonuclease and polymerase domains